MQERWQGIAQRVRHMLRLKTANILRCDHELDDFTILMRRRPFMICGFTCGEITLTVRIEDAWSRLPPAARRTLYNAQLLRDGASPFNMPNLVPDARIFLTLPPRSGFILSFTHV